MYILRYNLLKKLKEMSEIFKKEEELTNEILKEFCQVMLESQVASATFVAMFDSCSMFTPQQRMKKDKNPKRDFYILSRYIDKRIAYMVNEDKLFDTYDKKMNSVYASKNLLQREFLKMRSKYVDKDDIFDFSLLKDIEIETTQTHQQTYQFDPANLMI